MDNVFKLPVEPRYRKRINNLGTASVKTPAVPSYLKDGNSNITQATNNEIVLFCNPSVVPLAKEITNEIGNRLEVVSKIVPQDELFRISSDYINQLNAAFFEKIADQIINPGTASSVNSAAGSVCGSDYLQNVPRANPLLHDRLLLFNNDKKAKFNNTTKRVLNAAKNVQKAKHLTVINETIEGNGSLFVPRNETKSNKTSNRRGKKQMNILDETVTSSENSNESISNNSKRNAAKTTRNKPITDSNMAKPTTSTSKRRKIEYCEEDSVTSAELNITKNSLRNSSAIFVKKTKPKAVPRSQKQESENQFMRNIPGKPKKTALSPFFNRLKPSYSSTPLTKNFMITSN